MSEKLSKHFIIPHTHVNERLDQTLAQLMPEFSRTQIKEWIENGNITMNGQFVKPKIKVRGGESITLEATQEPKTLWSAESIPLSIVYEDNTLIIVNKPAGMVVHPGAGNQMHTLLNALLAHAPQLAMLPRAGILHRLDKNTSGLLVIAKTAAALKNLTQQLKKRSLIREYQAIVYGKLISGGKIDAPIGRHVLKRKQMSVTETGKPAITHYRVIEKYRAQTRLKIRLETGRTHQIRVHMSHIHHPIVGDSTYGGRVRLTKGMSRELVQALRDFRRQALHAFAIGLTHPETNEFINFEIELPDDMKELIKNLKEDACEIHNT